MAPTVSKRSSLLSSTPQPALAAGPASGPQHLETQRQRQGIHAQFHYDLRGASLDDCAALEVEDEGGDAWSCILIQVCATHS